MSTSSTRTSREGAGSSRSPQSSSATGGRSARTLRACCSGSRALSVTAYPRTSPRAAPRRSSSTRCPYVLTLIAVAGVIGRSIPPASDRPSVRQAVAWRGQVEPPGDRSSPGVASVAALPVAVYLTRFSDSYDLLHAGFVIPVAAASAWPQSCSPGARGASSSRSPSSGGSGVARRGPRPRRSSGSAWPRRRSSRSVSTACSSTSARAS